jgi:plasmid stabilization system protein ParE
MTKLPRRKKNGKPTPQPELKTPPDIEPPPRKRHPADELDALLAGPDDGGFLRGLDDRVVVYPTLVQETTESGDIVLRELAERDLYHLWAHYEERETELAWVRERAAYELGFDHGAADALATFLRTQAPGQSKREQRVGDQMRALMNTSNLTLLEMAHVMAETMWAMLNKPPAPPFDG